MAWDKDKAPPTREHQVGDATFKVRKCYTDAEGNTWYEFEDPLRMPAQRALAGEIAATWADLSITKQDARDYMRRMKAHARAGDIVKLFHLIEVLDQRLEWTCEDKTLLNLAQVYFLINDEPLTAGTVEHNTLKTRMFDRDADCRAFFLHRAFVLTSGFSKFSPSDIVNYLQVQQVELQKALERPPASVTERGPSAKRSNSGKTSLTSKPGYSPARSRRR